MRAVLPPPAADATPRLGERPVPVAGPGEFLLRVRATAINHVDLLQLRGRYPPPAGESEIPGLEVAGEVEAVGPEGGPWRPGDRAAAILGGGGHAEQVVVPAGQAIPIPEGWSFEEAAALPESALTAWTNLTTEGRLEAGETLLVLGATSAVGSYAVELGAALGARVVAAARDADRLEQLPSGAVARRILLQELPQALAEDRPDLVLDLVGGEHLPRALAALRPRGRLVLVGLMAGRAAEVDLGLVLRHRLTIVGSLLRSRSRREKATLMEGLASFAGERWARRELVPRIDSTFGFDEISAAYDHLRRGRPFGKVVVRIA